MITTTWYPPSVFPYPSIHSILREMSARPELNKDIFCSAQTKFSWQRIARATVGSMAMFHNTSKADVAMVLSSCELNDNRASSKQGRAQQLLSQGSEESFWREKSSSSTENVIVLSSVDIFPEFMKLAKLSEKNLTSLCVKKRVATAEVSIYHQ